MVMCTADWLPSTSTGTLCACAMRTISLSGVTVPSTFDMCVMATILVCWLNSCSNLSSWNSPSSVIGAHFSTAPRRSRWKCQGTMLEWCSMMERMISSFSPRIHAAERAGHQVDGFGGVAGEDDLVDAGRIEEAAHGLARVLVLGGGRVGEIVQPAMDVGVFHLVGVLDGLQHRRSASAPRRRCRDRRAACRRPRGTGSGSRCGCARRRRRCRPPGPHP